MTLSQMDSNPWRKTDKTIIRQTVSCLSDNDNIRVIGLKALSLTYFDNIHGADLRINVMSINCFVLIHINNLFH